MTMIKTTTAALILTAASTLAAASTADAAIEATRDSADFNFAVNGETEPGFIPGTGNTKLWTSDGDHLTLRSSPTQNGYFGYSNLTNPAVGYTVEFRFRIDEAANSANEPFVVALLAGDAANQYNVLGFTADKLYRNAASFTATGPTTEADLVLTHTLNDGQFHTVRLAEPANSGEGHLWIDGELVVLDYPSLNFNLDRVYLGDVGGGTASGQVTIDYLRFDNRGGFAPVPEPTSMAVLAAGALGLAVRRRRRAR